MTDDSQDAQIFERLARIFDPYRSRLIVKTDEPGHLYLDAPPSAAYPKGLFFGAVKIGKRYVSFHLMPVYVYPELVEAASPALRKRMQGKSCFNFMKPDDALFAELAELTAAGYAAYDRNGLVGTIAR
jgi:hypothetical protein